MNTGEQPPNKCEESGHVDDWLVNKIIQITEGEDGD